MYEFLYDKNERGGAMGAKSFFSRLAFALAFAPALASCAGAPSIVWPGAEQPEWVRNFSGYRASRPAYLLASGQGESRQAAEADALRLLIMEFGVDVQVDSRLAESYREMISGGAAATWEDVTFDRTIVLEAGIDNLMGVEIGDFWTDGRGSHHALAVMDRARAIRLYTEMLRANQEIIENLVDIPAERRNTLDGFSRHQAAAVIADVNLSYGAVLSVLGAPQPGLARGDDLRRAAREIAAQTPIAVNVRGDRAGRIQGAFARAFAELGFRTGGASPRYALEVEAIVLPTDHSGANVFARMELAANLVEIESGAVLLPFNFALREGHRTQSEAENRVFIVAEQRIDGEYRDLLASYLSQLVPRR
ncbi:MAG: LPP20 family lipoprotein [Treponema sp.]|nr:LPP20 family lipoprotein [Treponema sp.]